MKNGTYMCRNFMAAVKNGQKVSLKIGSRFVVRGRLTGSFLEPVVYTVNGVYRFNSLRSAIEFIAAHS